MIIGNFYLRRTSNGNLLGEYTNNENAKIYTETAIFKGDEKDSFVGTYNSTWLEGNGDDPYKSTLIISKKGNKYTLEWENNNVTFFGEGFVVDGILIGFYVDEDAKEKLDLSFVK